MRPSRLSSLFFLLAWITFGFTRPPQVQGGLDVTDIGVVYNFGQQITFQARLTSSIPITQATISFREVSEQNTRVEPLTLAADGTTAYQYDASQNLIPPFAAIVFSFQAALANGSTVSSPVYNFRYDDNRFTWQTLTDGPISAHWYEGDDAFGHAALDAARGGLQFINQIVPVSLSSPLDVYVYANASDLQSALQLGGRSWVAGHADPTLGVVMVSVAPGDTQTIELQRQIPHELAHVMLYRNLGAGYNLLPVWLNEGIASIAELYPNPDYASALKAASRNNALLPFSDLCASFPADSGGAFLAYAQSESFVRYLRDTYGNTGLVALTKAYADGLDCNLGTTRAVGVPLNVLETRWRAYVSGESVASVAAFNLLPYIIFLGLALIVPIWGALGIVRERIRNARSK